MAKDANIEVVYVASINSAHLEMVKLFLNHGKHVLCEKSLGVNVKEVKEMLDLAKSKNLFLMEAIWSRLQPGYLRLKEELDKGSIGKVLQVNVEFGFDISFIPNVAKKEMGGGATLAMGIYCIQLIQLVYNGEKPGKILAGGHLNDQGVDMNVSGTLLYSEDKTASFQYHVNMSNGCEAVIYGTEGKMKLKFPLMCPDGLELKDGSVEKFTLPPEGSKFKYNLPNSAGLRLEAQHVRECLLQGFKESPKLTHAETLVIAEIMEECRKQVGVVYDQD